MGRGKDACGVGIFQPQRYLSGGFAEGGEDGFGGLAMGQVAGVNADAGGFAVEGFAFAVEFFQGGAGIFSLQQGAFAVFDALVEVFRVGVEPDNGSDLREEAAVFRGDDHTAAGGDDEADAADEGLQHVVLDAAEGGFPLVAEDVGNGATGLADHEVVGIDKGKSGERGQDASDAGFAGAHESDENQVAEHDQTFTTFWALGPRSLGEISNSTESPSSRVLKPSPRISE